jgi:hypothetical protein
LGLYGAFGYDLTFQFEPIPLVHERNKVRGPSLQASTSDISNETESPQLPSPPKSLPFSSRTELRRVFRDLLGIGEASFFSEWFSSVGLPLASLHVGLTTRLFSTQRSSSSAHRSFLNGKKNHRTKSPDNFNGPQAQRDLVLYLPDQVRHRPFLISLLLIVRFRANR